MREEAETPSETDAPKPSTVCLPPREARGLRNPQASRGLLQFPF